MSALLEPLDDACLLAYQAHLLHSEQAGTYHVFRAGWLAAKADSAKVPA